MAATSRTWTFLSTLPVRGATLTYPMTGEHFSISIHAPREGSDQIDAIYNLLANISIHAPREGSDPTPPPAR